MQMNQINRTSLDTPGNEINLFTTICTIYSRAPPYFILLIFLALDSQDSVQICTSYIPIVFRYLV